MVNKTGREELRFARGLAACSQVLLQPVHSQEEEIDIFSDALEQVRRATGTSRAFLYRNFSDPEAGLCSGGVAVAADPQYPPRATVPWLINKIPWSIAPKAARRSLESGKPFGGIVEEAFATTPDFLQTLRDDGVLSVQFFPIHLGDNWWGYVGFDERQRVRRWKETEILLLGTVAEMFANAIQRWRHIADLDNRTGYEEALSRASRILHQVVHSEDEENTLLTRTLEQLRRAVHAGRAYLFESFTDPELGVCIGMRAETCAPNVRSQIDNPANRRMPLSALPSEMYQTLAAGQPFGGPIDRAFASRPEWVKIFKKQEDPLLSIQQFPIHFGDKWWGFVGFDDVEEPREWRAEEIRILRVAAEVIGNALQRWQTEAALRAELEERRRREERLRLLESVIVNTSEGVLILSGPSLNGPEPDILYANEAFSQLTGYKAEEVVGKSLRILQGPKTSRQELHRMRVALASQEHAEVELLHYRKDGSDFWVRMSVAPVLDDDGGCTHFVAVQTDITARRRTELALEVAKEELEERVARRTREILQANEQLHMEIISRRQAEAKVRQRLALEEALADISRRLVQEPDVRAILPAILRDVAAIVNAGRVGLIFLGDGGEVGEVYEWHAAATRPLERTFLEDVAPAFDWMWVQLQEQQRILLESSEQISATGATGKKIVEYLDIESAAAYPIVVDDKLGAILVGGNFVKKDGELSQQLYILDVVSDLLGSALQREALLDSLEQRAIDRTRELAAFYDMTMLAAEAESLSDVLQPALTQIMKAVRCQAITVYELSDERTTLRLVAQFGLDQGECQNAITLPERFGQWFDKLNEPIIEGGPVDAPWLPESLRAPGFAVYIGAQMRARGKPLGVLSCYRQTDRAYSLNSTALVVALAEQLGIIIENYRLRQRAEEAATIEERQRLARDLHDAITQSLYSVTLFARSSVDALEAGEFDRATEMMTEVEHNALRTLKEMRLLLHQLQPLALEQGGLEQAVERRLNQVERRLGIGATLIVGNGLRLNPRTEESLYRIVTEALNNSLRYAQASHVSIVLREKHAFLRLEVQDNGRGFDMAKRRLGLGITNMQERVAMLKGELNITSIPGEGTTIAVDLPANWLEYR